MLKTIMVREKISDIRIKHQFLVIFVMALVREFQGKQKQKVAGEQLF